MHSDEGYVLRALKAGARAYILKNSAEADLIRAVDAHRGNILQKLNLHGVPELVLYAVRKGIIQ